MTPAAVRDRLTVLHIIDNAAGADYFKLLLRNCDQEHFRYVVGSLSSPGPLQETLSQLGVSTFSLGVERKSQLPWAVRRLTARLRRERVDVLHTHLFEASLVGICAGYLAGTPVKIFTGHHSHEVPLHERRLLLGLDTFAARAADFTFAPSDEMAHTLRTAYGLDASRVTVIEHGVDLVRFDPTEVSGAGFRAQHGLEGRLVIGAVSKYHWIKNLRALVEAFTRVASVEPNAVLVVVGAGDPAELRAFASACGLADRVLLLEATSDVPSVLAAYDVFAHPARAESFGLAIVEAMAMKLPVVTTPVGIAPQVISHGTNGFIIPSYGPSEIAASLLDALAQRAKWQEMGIAARDSALRFEAKAWTRRHEELYSTLVRQSTPARR